jgi:hypothetical protein
VGKRVIIPKLTERRIGRFCDSPASFGHDTSPWSLSRQQPAPAGMSKGVDQRIIDERWVTPPNSSGTVDPVVAGSSPVGLASDRF